MSDNYTAFLNSVQPEAVKFLKPYHKIGDKDYTNCTLKNIEEVIISFKPKNTRAITTIVNIMLQYARFLNDTHMEEVIKSVNRTKLWDRYKDEVSGKFLSNKQYVDLCNQITINEPLNTLYKRTLFMAAYEGIYSDDLSVYKNLRASDIHGNIVTIRSDSGSVRDVEVSNVLAKCLIELGLINTWERQNAYGLFTVEISGAYSDCCFKLETRANSTSKPTAYKDNYYRLFRTVSNEYLGYSTTAKQVYISGIMYRVCKNIKAAGFNPEDIMREHKHSNSKNINNIFKEEFQRSGYTSSVANFKEYIRGYAEIFFEDIE